MSQSEFKTTKTTTTTTNLIKDIVHQTHNCLQFIFLFLLVLPPGVPADLRWQLLSLKNTTQQDGRVCVFTFFLCKHKKSPKSLHADAALDLRELWKGMKTRGRIPTLAEGVAAGLQSGACALPDITECRLPDARVFQPTRSEKWSNYKEVKDGLSSFLGLSNPTFVKLLNSAFKSKFQNMGSAELELV